MATPTNQFAHVGLLPDYTVIPLQPSYHGQNPLASILPPGKLRHNSEYFWILAWHTFRRFETPSSPLHPPYLAIPPQPDDLSTPPYILVRIERPSRRLSAREYGALLVDLQTPVLAFWQYALPFDEILIPAPGTDMFSNSKKWIAPQVKVAEKAKRANQARHKLCKDSDAWPVDYDIEKHKQLYAQDLKDQRKRKQQREFDDRVMRMHLGLPPVTENKVKPAFGGKEFDNNFGTVLGLPTVFCPGFEEKRFKEYKSEEKFREVKELAEFPCRDESKYEGDDRISTDPLHRRFLGLPRVPGNNTVNWMQRSVIDQYPLENFYPIPDADDVFWRFNTVDDYFQFTDEEGRKAIGNDLMDILDE